MLCKIANRNKKGRTVNEQVSWREHISFTVRSALVGLTFILLYFRNDVNDYSRNSCIHRSFLRVFVRLTKHPARE